jgi:hypothetical protein
MTAFAARAVAAVVPGDRVITICSGEQARKAAPVQRSAASWPLPAGVHGHAADPDGLDPVGYGDELLVDIYFRPVCAAADTAAPRASTPAERTVLAATGGGICIGSCVRDIVQVTCPRRSKIPTECLCQLRRRRAKPGLR